MRGITEEKLLKLRKKYKSNIVYKLIDYLIKECTELNAWQPIETAPKDRMIWGWVDGRKRLIKWGKTSHVPLYGFCLADQGAEDFDICHPTHWQELPEDPK